MLGSNYLGALGYPEEAAVLDRDAAGLAGKSGVKVVEVGARGHSCVIVEDRALSAGTATCVMLGTKAPKAVSLGTAATQLSAIR